MKKNLLLLILSLLLSGQLLAQSLGYDNHRIAISADGNNQPDNHPEAQWPRADPDDWGGTPASLAIIAKLGLQDKVVHFSYNNFIDAPAHTTETNYMKEAAEGGIEKWNFKEGVFFDVPEDPATAITHLAEEIGKSTADDPLYFIHMGTSEFFYRAVQEVIDDGKIETLAHVQIISHSGFNDNHLRREAHHTMQEAITLSGDRLKYKKIQDQNGCENLDQLWCSGTNFTPWKWMETHSDPNIQWVYSRMQFHPQGKGADISDAGMVYYLLLGDEFGSPEKFQNFIGDGIPLGAVIPVEGIDIFPETMNAYIGRGVHIGYALQPADAWNQKTTWKSSDSEVAYVSDKGVIFGQKEGTTTITVTTDEGNFSDVVEVTVKPLPECADLEYIAIKDFEVAQIDTFVTAYKDNGRNAIAVDAGLYKDKFAATKKVFDGFTGFYNISMTTLTEEDGESTFRLKVNGRLVGEFQNPVATTDMEPYTHEFKNVLIEKGDEVQIESNAHSNGLIPEGNGFAYARGRWRSLKFECLGECEVEEVNGLLIFEAERFSLAGHWKVGTDTEKASGGKYIYYDGYNSYQKVPEGQTISYTFKINNPGGYTVKWTMRQPEGERGGDLGNDAWIYFDGDIGRAKQQPLTHFEKFVGRSTDDFTLNGQLDLHNEGQPWMSVVFPEAGEYTINLSGRSAHFQVDRIILFKGMTIDDVAVKLTEIKETNNCDIVDIPEEEPVLATPKKFTLPYTNTPLEIDGLMDDSWNWTQWKEGKFEGNGKDLPEASDCSYSFKAMYDRNNVYFLVKVKDNKRVKYTEGSAFWDSDNIELFFNPDNEHNPKGEYGEDAMQIRLNYGLNNNLYSGNGNWKKGDDYSGFIYKSVNTNEGYIIEAQIPWDGIVANGNITEGMEMGFDISVSDRDDEAIKEHSIFWTNDTKEGKSEKDTYKFGNMILGSMQYNYMDQLPWEVLFVDSESNEEGKTPSLKEYAVDGDPGTFWHTQWFSAQPLPPHEIQIDFKDSFVISEIHYLPRQDEWGPNGAIGQYEIYLTDDLENWGDPVHTGQLDYGTLPTKEDYKKLQMISLPEAATGRYLRLVALTEAQNNPEIPYTAIAELNCIGKPLKTEEDPILNLSTSLPTMVLYPNPTQGTLHIKGLNAEVKSVVVYNMIGQEMINTQIESKAFHLDVQALKAGSYILKIETKNTIISKIFLKE
ncbi:sugar-binding protein [Flammeovirga sp. OC4]|uniref:sugar-binding protein n=1 Tax=Flammeovirga sp. OC4 TaxID=1382345 RepID=UPI0007C8360A|nr:sugar-binding protein [Flammeovirga sp. OC4]